MEETIEVGSPCSVSGKDEFGVGIVRFFGQTKFKEGLWVGIEFPKPSECRKRRHKKEKEEEEGGGKRLTKRRRKQLARTMDPLEESRTFLAHPITACLCPQTSSRLSQRFEFRPFIIPKLFLGLTKKKKKKAEGRRTQGRSCSLTCTCFCSISNTSSGTSSEKIVFSFLSNPKDDSIRIFVLLFFFRCPCCCCCCCTVGSSDRVCKGSASAGRSAQRDRDESRIMEEKRSRFDLLFNTLLRVSHLD